MRSLLPWTVAPLAVLCGSAGAVGGAAGTNPAAGVDFNRDVPPILTRRCFKYHGPDDKQRQAGLRLDVRAAALKPGAYGRKALVPGNPAESEVVRRLFLAHGSGGQMPPSSANNPLTAEQKDVV